jgi:hypothetical protein
MAQGNCRQEASSRRLCCALLVIASARYGTERVAAAAELVHGANPSSSEQHTLLVATTAGLSIAFSPSAVPLSIKNAEGHELLGVGSPGFTLYCSAFTAEQHQSCNQSEGVAFDTCVANGSDPNELTFTFGISASDEELDVTFSGAHHYLTANITSTRGFEWGDGKSVRFALVGKAPDALRGMGLNFMIDDASGEGHNNKPHPILNYEAPWVNSTWNPHARFAVYERVDDATEDETLFDLWVDEGLAHPRVNGSWDRPTAKAWVETWTKATYDISHLAMVPRNLSEWRDFFPYGKLMDAKSLWFNFRVWAGSEIDNVSPKMFPSGVPGFKSFSDDAAKHGFRITTHRMSGGLMPDDPDYCVKPDPGLLGWGNMHLMSNGAAGVDRVAVKPQPGIKIPVPSNKWKSNMSTQVYQEVKADLGACSIGDEMLFYQNIAPLPDGNWEIVLRTKTKQAHPSGSLVRGYIKGNEYFIPDLFSPLYEEIAVRYADFSNLVGFDDGSFDGAAWFGWYGRWAFFKFATLVYENLDHPTVVHTSGLVVSSAWPEYRFNSVKAAFGGSFTTQPGGISLEPGYVGLDTSSLDRAALELTSALCDNTRQFSVGHDLRSTLDVYNDASGHGVGNVEQVLTLVNEYKRGSLAMGPEQRQCMRETVMTKQKHPRISNVLNASWMVEGAVFRKWVSTGTEVYDYKAYSMSSFIPPRFYAQSESRVALVPPTELQAGFEKAQVIGRVLPRFDALSPMNIDLFEKMKVAGATLQLSAHNPSPMESWDEGRLKEYRVLPALNLTQHQGIGMFVDGDGSGGTLVVRVVCGTTARDYAAPLTFTGRQWVEIPSPEQGLRVSNWGPIGKGAAIWAGINFAEAVGISIGIGYMPPSATTNVTVSGLQALSEIREPLVDPQITVGDETVHATGTLQAYDHFILAPDGTFTIYDQSWKMLCNNTVGTFKPTNLSSFQMSVGAPGKKPLWLEVGVVGATETVPNPGWTPRVREGRDA